MFGLPEIDAFCKPDVCSSSIYSIDFLLHLNKEASTLWIEFKGDFVRQRKAILTFSFISSDPKTKLQQRTKIQAHVPQRAVIKYDKVLEEDAVFSFVNYQSILDSTISDNTPIDVIGEAFGVKKLEIFASKSDPKKETKKMKFRLHDLEVDDDQIKSIFGTVAIDKESPPQGSPTSPSKEGQMRSVPFRVYLLDTRKSQNIAIVLKSISISREKIIECLQEGQDLDMDTLEKLNRITLSKEEATIILEFEGDISKLADAESFLYYLLRPVPSAFTRFSIMLFKLNYCSEVSDLNNSLRTLETACKELKARGLFVKLLEAVLKAGNRMNAGTSRGNAQAFNLNSLLKLSDVKSSDGTTTLLHFVVEEVVRLEGKHCNINRSNSGSSSSSGAFTENHYIKLGLPVVGGVSSEFLHVKKAAGIDYDAFSKSCSGLRNSLAEIKKTLEECEGGFLREMGKFLEGAEMEIKGLREEEERVMWVVKTTSEYYQAGGSKEFELFVIIRDFLEMVDKACVDIAVKLQKRRTGGGLPELGMPPPVKFPALPSNFRIGSN
ncbi:hypothetical protein LXL04_020969 [Taraxacum kok-saghyz]